VIFNTEDQLSEAWAAAQAIIDHLSESISTDAAVAAADGSATIADHAKAAIFMVAGALSGLILLFTAGVYFMRWAVVKPIIRVTRNLEQVKASHRPVELRREWLRELDNIALAVQAFGTALARLSQYAIELEQEIAERQKAQAQLLELAITDSLTGLHNRRHFMESAQQELDRARRYQTPLSLALLDADHFKAVNDRYGHPVGDQALQMLAATGRRLLRDIDLFARIGGEEFAILLPQTDHAAAWIVADRLRQAIMDQPIATEQGPLHLTVSLGLASLDPATVDLDDLIRRADLALYQAKQNGRNRVESALDSMD
jgi:diguanylate cyclase (GGDEF)-like protein